MAGRSNNLRVKEYTNQPFPTAITNSNILLLYFQKRLLEKKKGLNLAPVGREIVCGERFIHPDPRLPLRAWRPPRLCLRTRARGRTRDC